MVYTNVFNNANFAASMDSSALFSKYLKENETVLWAGQPKMGMQLRDADIIIIPVSIILIGFAVGLNFIMLQFDAPFIFKIAAVMFGFAGIYFGVIRFILDLIRRKRTYYCITSRRVLVISGSKKKLQTLPLKNIERLDKTEEKDGSGFIIFGNTNPLWPWLIGKFIMPGDNVPGLVLIPDVKTVYAILEEQIKVEMPEILLEKLKDEKKEQMN